LAAHQLLTAFFLTKKSFGSLVQVGLQMALDSSNLTEVVEIKAPPVYYADNFILKQLNNATKLEVNNTKNIWRFTMEGICKLYSVIAFKLYLSNISKKYLLLF
jgi:hypothetical protein